MILTLKNSVGYHFCGRELFFSSNRGFIFKLIRQVWYSILPVIFFVESSVAQTWLDAGTDSLIQQGIELSIQHDYSKAESIFQQLIRGYPDHPGGYFFMAATIQSKMMDYESDQWRQDFHHYIRWAIDLAARKEAASPAHDLWSRFYHGSALCYLAFYEGRKGDYLKAINHGFSGIAILKKIIKIDPEFYDAYFGIGSYKYWRSQKTKFLSWLPLVADDREEGILMVRQAIRQGKYTQYAGMNELIWILLDADQPAEAYSWALNGLEQFPQSRFFLWGAAKSALALENYPAAVAHFQQLLTSIINSHTDSDYNEYICRLKLAQCFEKLGNWAEASAHIEILESWTLSPEMLKKLKKQRAELFQLKTRLALFAKIEQPVHALATEHQFADKQRRQ